MPVAVLGLGGNLGARRAIFHAALQLLDDQPQCRVLSRSALYETPPLGPPQPDYLNAALRVQFAGEVAGLLTLAQRIEVLLGRERRERWGPRTLDIDVLHWSEGAVRTATLEVPHGELGARAFALAPLLDVAPELASRWQHTLRALGGPPPLAEPGWSAVVREGAYVCGSWFHDDSELASQLVEVFATTRAVVELAGAAVARGARLSTHAFTGPSELFDGDGRSWLSVALADAGRRGFVVQSGAVLARDQSHAAGVLLGFEGCSPAHLGTLTFELEQHTELGRRVKMPDEAPERGFDFNGSGTM